MSQMNQENDRDEMHEFDIIEGEVVYQVVRDPEQKDKVKYGIGRLPARGNFEEHKGELRYFQNENEFFLLNISPIIIFVHYLDRNNYEHSAQIEKYINLCNLEFDQADKQYHVMWQTFWKEFRFSKDDPIQYEADRNFDWGEKKEEHPFIKKMRRMIEEQDTENDEQY